MNRPKQAKLLGPSLILLAFAVACGGTVEYQQGGPNPPDPTPAGAGGTAGGVVTKPQPTMSAGFGGTIGGPISSQPTHGHPSCPVSIPLQGSWCGSASDPNAYSCNYDDQFGCGQASAECYHGTWNLRLTGSLCGFAGATGQAGAPGEAGATGIPFPPKPPVPLTCPSGIPKTGTSCYLPLTVSSYRCDYADACTQYFATCKGIWLVDERLECAGAGGI